MAISTLRKRSAALRFGMAHLAGTRPPSSPLNTFERAALLGCYWSVTVGVPEDGWSFEPDTTVFTFEPDATVFTFGD